MDIIRFECFDGVKFALKLTPYYLQAIMRAFSREALELYIPIIQEEVRAAVKEWLVRDSCVLVYPEMKRLMFRIAMRILLGFEPEQIKTDEQELVEAFEEMIKNLFSLPIDVPFSGLYRVREEFVDLPHLDSIMSREERGSLYSTSPHTE